MIKFPKNRASKPSSTRLKWNIDAVQTNIKTFWKTPATQEFCY